MANRMDVLVCHIHMTVGLSHVCVCVSCVHVSRVCACVRTELKSNWSQLEYLSAMGQFLFCPIFKMDRAVQVARSSALEEHYFT